MLSSYVNHFSPFSPVETFADVLWAKSLATAFALPWRSCPWLHLRGCTELPPLFS